MRTLLILFFLALNISVFSQLIDTTKKEVICQRTLESLQYHAPKHSSPRFKITMRTAAFNSTVLLTLIQQPDIFDGILVSQAAKYNIRFRFRLNNQNRVFVGTETMSAGYGKNCYYLGFRKCF